MKKLDVGILSELLEYNPESGEIHWRERESKWFKKQAHCDAWNTRFAGKLAGNISRQKGRHLCLSVSILGKNYLAHRVVWAMVTGEWPKDQIDHINRDGTDNRWGNLREVDQAENNKNKSKRYNSPNKKVGVNWDKRLGKWRSLIQESNKQKHLGVFDCFLDAVSVRIKAERELGYSEGHGQNIPTHKYCN